MLFKALVISLAVSAWLAGPVLADLTLYSHRHYEGDEELYKTFTKKTGIKVHVVKAKADELIERLKAEGAATKADIFMTADVGRLQKAKAAGLLQTASSETLTRRIPEHLQDKDGQWFGLTMRARIIAYDKTRVKPEELSTYEQLADEAWRSRILVRSSANIYNQSLMASIIATHGEEKAEAWARAVRKNMARPPQGSDRDQMRAVAKGLADIAVVNTYYIGLLANSSSKADQKVAAKMGVFFPNQDDRGTHVNVSGAGIVKGSQNTKEAVAFLEFLASDEAQATFPNTTYEYPVVQGVVWEGFAKQWGDFKMDTASMSRLGELNAAAVETFNKAGWE